MKGGCSLALSKFVCSTVKRNDCILKLCIFLEPPIFMCKLPPMWRKWFTIFSSTYFSIFLGTFSCSLKIFEFVCSLLDTHSSINFLLTRYCHFSGNYFYVQLTAKLVQIRNFTFFKSDSSPVEYWYFCMNSSRAKEHYLIATTIKKRWINTILGSSPM